MINLMKNILNLFKKLDFNSIKLGIKKGISIPTLPYKFNRIYSHFFIRILRVIGGFFAIMVLTKNHTLFPYPFDYIAIFIAIIQIFQIIIISIIKVIYSIKKLIKNPKEFEVRNSPLNRYASQIAQLVYCWKFTCTAVGGGVGIIASGAAIDQLLEAGGHSKVFLPFLGRPVKFLLAPNEPQSPSLIYENYKKKLTELSHATAKADLFKEAINKISNEDLSNYDLKDEDAEAVKQGIAELIRASEEDRTALREELLKLLDKKSK